MTIDIGDTHSKHIMAMIDQVIGVANVNIADVDGFAVTRGPGTFTGLRIGMGTVKGLALALDRPVAGVSSLEALAVQTCCTSLICSLIDARRDQVYCRCYRCKDNEIANPCSPERVCSLREAIASLDEPVMFIGSGALLYASHIRARLGSLACFAPCFQHTIRASTVALLGWEKIRNGNIEDLAGFVPVYLRKSDAELNLEKQNNARQSEN